MELQDKSACLVNIRKTGFSAPTEKKSTRIRVMPSIVQITQGIASTMEELLKKVFLEHQTGTLSIIRTIKGKNRIEMQALGNMTFHEEVASDV